MTSIRKFWWAGITLAAFVGCAEEPSATAPGPASTPAGPGPAPSTPPAASPTTSDTDKGEMKKDGAKPAPTEPEKTDAPKVEAPKPDAPKTEGDTKGASTKLTDDQVAEIKKLPAEDQPLALKQMVCPVSGDNLGGEMGVPVKITAGGKTFFLCCKGCKKEVDADPAAIVAKLKN